MKLTILVTLLALTTGCSHENIQPVTEYDTASLTNAEAVRDIILGLESWPQTSFSLPGGTRFSNQELADYELAAIKIQQFSLSEQLAGVQLSYDSLSEGELALFEQISANAFVLLRIAYSVPSVVPDSEPQVRAPYTVFTDRPTGYYPLGWPVEIASTDLLTDIHGFVGFKGGPHRLLDEWKWLATTYQQRNIPGCATRCGQYSPSEPCQCDSACVTYGDCCSDHEWSCPGSGTLLSTQSAGAESTPAARRRGPPRSSRWPQR